jgi:hypothetical protein
MPEGLPRIVLVLTATVAIAAIVLGVKDYFQPRAETKSSASTTAATVAQPDAKDVHNKNKKNALADARRKRTSGSEVKSAAAGQAAEDESESLLAPTVANSTLLVVKDNALHAMPTAGDGEQATTDTDGSLQKKVNSKSAKPTTITVSPECMPLPNMTGPEDVDAQYYRNWAREYSCQL